MTSLLRVVQGFIVKPGRGIWHVVAQLVLDRYADFDDDQKLALFALLANEMDMSCSDAVAALKSTKVHQQRPIMVRSQSWSNQRLQFIRRLNQTQNATTQLVAMRHDLLRLLDQQLT